MNADWNPHQNVNGSPIKIQQADGTRVSIYGPSSKCLVCPLGFDNVSLFVRINTSFYGHLKTIKLRSYLGNDAFWIPPRIWSVAADQRPDGSFENVTAEQLSMLINYTGDASSMLQALLDCGFMDSNPLRIHNWDLYNGYHAAYAERASKAAKARWNKRRKGEREEKRREEPSNAQALLQASRGFMPPNIEEIAAFAKETGKDSRHVESFFNHYESNGWRVGKNIMKKWKAAFAGWCKRNEDGTYGLKVVRPNYATGF